MDTRVVGDVVAVVAPWRLIEWQHPNRGDAEFLQVVELAGKAREIAHAIGAAVTEGADVHFVEDGVFVPANRAFRWQ
jgi:hypothetical protein